jgi:hypothetical protein
MDVIFRSAEMFYVHASWNDKGGQTELNITVKPLPIISQGTVESENKCRKMTAVERLIFQKHKKITNNENYKFYT